MEQKEIAVLELIQKSNDPEAALKAARARLMPLQGAQETAPVYPAAIS